MLQYVCLCARVCARVHSCVCVCVHVLTPPCVCLCVSPRLLEAGSAVQILSLSEQHLAELDGDTLRLVGPGALEALERGWGAQTAGAVCTITFRYVQFDAIVPTLPRIRVKFPNLTVRVEVCSPGSGVRVLGSGVRVLGREVRVMGSGSWDQGSRTWC